MSKRLKVWPITTKVILPGNVEGSIIGIYIRADNKVVYDVVWWSNGERTSEVLQEIEFTVKKGTEPQPIGFNPKPHA